MNLTTINAAIAKMSPAEQLAIKLAIEESMVNKEFYEDRNICIETRTDSPSFHNSKVTTFEESVKVFGGTIRQRGVPTNKDGLMITCVCFKIPKGTEEIPLPK